MLRVGADEMDCVFPEVNVSELGIQGGRGAALLSLADFVHFARSCINSCLPLLLMCFQSGAEQFQ